MENLTIEEKVGQMLIVGMDGTEITNRIKNLIQKYKVSGIILYRKNFKTCEDMIKLISELKKLNSQNKIPLFIAIDQEGGRVNRMPPEVHNLLSAYRIANTKDLSIIKESGNIIGEMLSKSGYNMVFSPVLDVLRKNTTDALGNRCFGRNAEDVSKYAIEVMKQLQNHNVVSVVKHFPGQGAAKTDSHYLLPSIGKIEEQDIEPFLNAIENGADTIMVGHMIVKNISRLYPASLSKKMIRKIRLKYNFKGVIMTDDLKMRAIKNIYGTKWALKKAILIGNDLILFRFKEKDEKQAIESIIKLVKEGKIKERRIDRSVKRILEIKEKYNINDNEEIEGFNIEEINNRIDIVNQFVETNEQI